ncbi:MAG TPA: ROK family protein [Anaerolineaceae bacterium]|nr:ROK family protein [Anaerolineaceae bacterium]
MAVLGIDIGGSGIKGAVVDLETGQLLTERKRFPTPEKSTPAAVAKVVRQLAGEFEVQGPIGCGFPAVVRSGVAYTAANIHESWIGTDVNQLLTDATGCPVFTVNDADAAGVAEMAYGAGRDYPKGVVMVLTLGTGIGSAIFVDGHLLPNTEFGHLEIRGKDAEHRASDAVRERKDLSYKKWAKRRLQEVLERYEMLLSPDVFIIGGGVSKNFDDFVPYVETRAKIIPAQLLNQAGIVGAALYAQQQA